MGQFTHNGVIYEEAGNGQVRVVGYAQQPGAITLGTPDTNKSTKETADATSAAQRAADAVAAAPYRAQSAADDFQIKHSQAIDAKAKSDTVEANAKLATMASNSDLHGEAYLKKYVPAQQQAMVRAYARGDLGSRAGGMSTSMLPIIQHAMNYDPTVSATTFPARAKMYADYAGSQPNTIGGGLRAVEQQLLHGVDVLHNGAALNNYGPGKLGKVENYVKNLNDRWNDDPALARYNQSVRNYAPESQKGIAGAAGIGAEREDRHDAYAPTLSQNTRAATLQADAIQAFQRTGALDDQNRRLLGKGITDLLPPRAQQAYDEIMSGGYDANGKALHPAPGYVQGSVFGSAGHGDGGGGSGSGPSSPTGAAPFGPNSEGATIASGATRTVPIAAANAIIDSGVRRGRSVQDVNADLKAGGFQEIQPDNFGTYSAAIKYSRDHPEYKGGYGQATRTEATTPLNQIAASPLATGIVSAGNAALGGLPGALTGTTPQMQAMAALNWKSGLAGDILGSAAGAYGVEGLLGKAAGGLAAKYGANAASKALSSPVASDALYSGISGASADPEHPLAGGIVGGLAGVGGGMFGRRVATPLLSGVVGGVAAPAVRYLADRNIPMTVGQALGQSGFLGRTIGKLEQAGTSIPGSGSMIHARYQDGLTGVNQAAFQEAADQAGLKASGQIGSAGAADLHGLKRSAYGNALDGTSYQIDPQAVADLSSAVKAGRSVPGRADSFDYAMNKHVAPNIDTNGVMTGTNMQDTLRGLKISARPASQGAGAVHPQDFSDALNGVQNAITGMVDRQNPGASARLGQANSLNRYSSILDDALNGAAKNNGEIITPAALNTASVNNTNKYFGRSASAEGARPFYDLASNAQSVMGNVTPNSGTFDRMAAAKTAAVGTSLLGGLGGAGYGLDGTDGAKGATGLGLGAVALGALGGTRVSQHLLTKALLDRPEVLQKAGAAIAARARFGGMFGTGAGAAIGGGYLAPLLLNGPQ